MASNISEAATNADSENGDKKLHDIFLDGWKIFEEVELSDLSSNSTDFQEKVKASMGCFENATRIVSEIGMFSSNEHIDEVSTESLQYMLLPYFLGKLALKITQQDRMEVLNVADVYFKDYLLRCQEYELCDAPKHSSGTQENGKPSCESGNTSELAGLMRDAHSRNQKIALYNKHKEFEKKINLIKEAVRNNSVDEEVRREFFLNFLNKGIIESNQELDDIKLEKQIVEMRKLQMATGGDTDGLERIAGNAGQTHAEHHHQGHHHHHSAQPKPKPLQPFIITRNNQQKAVFGMGYPSLPVMTVDDFYKQRVQEGIFPDEEKVAKMNAAQAIAAAQDPNEKEDAENAVEEEQVENDDPEYLARMRRMDEYKDVVRRGDGNRYNRS